jgi:hypothetical protein
MARAGRTRLFCGFRIAYDFFLILIYFEPSRNIEQVPDSRRQKLTRRIGG